MTSGDPSDAALATQAALGDRRAYSVLVRAYGPQLAMLVRTYGVIPGDVEDVVQEAFVAAWRALADYDSSKSFRAWVCQIALNKARDWRRRRRVRSFFFGAVGIDETEAQSVEDTTPNPESSVDDRRRLEAVRAAIAELPDDLRIPFLMVTTGAATFNASAVPECGGPRRRSNR